MIEALYTIHINLYSISSRRREQNNVLETNVRVDDDGGADGGVHDRAHGAGGEGSNAEGNETGRNDSVTVSGAYHHREKYAGVTHLSKVQW